MRYRVNKHDLAAAFGVSTQTIDAWLARGCPKPQRRGREQLFDLSSVLNWRLIHGQRYRSRVHERLHDAGHEAALLDGAWMLAFVAAPELLPAGVDADDIDEPARLLAWREALAAHPPAAAAMREFAAWLMEYVGADRAPYYLEGLPYARTLNQPGA